jgi:hypothetical protein
MRAVKFLIDRILHEPPDAFLTQAARELEGEEREGDE